MRDGTQGEGADRRSKEQQPGDELFALLQGSPREVLRKLHEGDPLGFYPACVKFLDREAYMLDPGRLFSRAIAMAATTGASLSQDRDITAWTQGLIQESAVDLIDEDWGADQEDLTPPEDDAQLTQLVQVFEVDRSVARRITVVLNLLPVRVRRAFFRIAIQGVPVRRYVAQGNGPPKQVTEDVDRALKAILLLIDPTQEGGGDSIDL